MASKVMFSIKVNEIARCYLYQDDKGHMCLSFYCDEYPCCAGIENSDQIVVDDDSHWDADMYKSHVLSLTPAIHFNVQDESEFALELRELVVKYFPSFEK